MSRPPPAGVNLAIIPARGGSRRIPRKNIRLFYGKPIVAYSIGAAKESGLFENVIVSTEDREIAAIARARGARIHHRARDLADDLTGTQDVVRAAIKGWQVANGRKRAGLVCCIYATAPLLQAYDLTVGLALLARAPYAYVPGIYYWGRAQAFLDDVPLTDGIEVRYPAERYIDINTEDDWRKAELMYRAMKEAVAA